MTLHSQLAMKLPHGETETPTSFASRLAALNGCPTLRDFCHDMDFTVYDLAHGKQHVLGRLERLGGVVQGELSPYALERTEDGFSLNGQRLRKQSLRRERIHVCPACLTRDIAVREGPPALRAFARAYWSLAPIRTCPVHATALVGLDGHRMGVHVYDFARAVEPMIAHLERMVGEAAPMPLSPLESYLLDRLWSVERTSVASLDSLPWYAVARACEMIGAVASFGPRFNAGSMSTTDWVRAGGAGFRIITGDGRTFVDLIDDLRNASTAHDWGLRATFGRLYEWLAHENEDPAYDPFRRILRERSIETMPFGPGDEIFGEPVAVRKIHSIRSAHYETGRHQKRLRKLLLEVGVIGDDDLAKTDDRILFPAEIAKNWLAETSEAMSLNAAGEYLNAPRVQIRMLFERGFIQPFVVGGKQVRSHAFSRAELDAFLARLLNGAVPIDSVAQGQANIPDAGRQACCSAPEIINLILDGRLRWVGRLRSATGYLSVIVNVDEVRALIRLPDHGGLSLREVERRIQTSTMAVKALIREGHLPAQEAINPTNRCPQTIVMPADLEEFRATFVSLSELAKERGLASRRLMGELREGGVQFAFDPGAVEGHFYRRTDLIGAEGR